MKHLIAILAIVILASCGSHELQVPTDCELWEAYRDNIILRLESERERRDLGLEHRVEVVERQLEVHLEKNPC